jgi:hypothetical protein
MLDVMCLCWVYNAFHYGFNPCVPRDEGGTSVTWTFLGSACDTPLPCVCHFCWLCNSPLNVELFFLVEILGENNEKNTCTKEWEHLEKCLTARFAVRRMTI